VGTKAERRAARERVAAYHEARLAELIAYIVAAVDRYRAGESVILYGPVGVVSVKPMWPKHLATRSPARSP
jgi:hypothetical protein